VIDLYAMNTLEPSPRPHPLQRLEQDSKAYTGACYHVTYPQPRTLRGEHPIVWRGPVPAWPRGWDGRRARSAGHVYVDADAGRLVLDFEQPAARPVSPRALVLLACHTAVPEAGSDAASCLFAYTSASFGALRWEAWLLNSGASVRFRESPLSLSYEDGTLWLLRSSPGERPTVQGKCYAAL